jgi:excinuclease ABC subunit A
MRITQLRGARTHNLRGIDLDLVPGELVAVAGPSGAGKSSLAFGTLYAEGQRRYVESFSAYARQFLERLARPPVDSLDPVPAGVAVDRQAPVRTSRSTVGTMTEIADYAKSLWARASILHCEGCDQPVLRESAEDAARKVLAEAAGERVIVTYPTLVSGVDELLSVREALIGAGYRRVVVDGAVRDLDGVKPSEVLGDELAPLVVSAPKTAKKQSKKKAAKKAAKKRIADEAAAEASRAATLEVVTDRAVAREEDRGRLVEAFEAAMARSEGVAYARREHGAPLRFSRGLHCARCDVDYRDPTPGLFSFNNAIGACDSCRGFGRVIGIDWNKVLPDQRRSIKGGAIACWSGKSTEWERRELSKFADEAGVPTNVPLSKLTPDQLTWLKEGDGQEPRARFGGKRWWGLRAWFGYLETKAYKMHVRVLLSRFRSYEECPACHGARLKPEALRFRIAGKTIAELFALPAGQALAFTKQLETLPAIANDPPSVLVLRELVARLTTLVDVGLPYVSLDRTSRTLSGGESQRVALTSALSSSLTGTLFVLDEPTVGLHPSDVPRLVDVVRRLADGDNIAMVVEHDPEIIEAADRVIELGPGAGEHGGQLVFDGTPKELAKADTATGRALREIRDTRHVRRPVGKCVELRGATGHNLKGVDARFPLGALTCVTGPSGSGKSSLVLETLVPAIERRTSGMSGSETALPFEALEGIDALHTVSHVDQSPIGRTSRGNAATYLGVWDAVRKRYAREPIAKERDYADSYFSFNVAGGRCETCKGDGAETIEMQFLADVTFSCPDCGGKRFVGAVLDVKVGGLDVSQALELTASGALAHFAADKTISKRLAPLVEVGLGYLRLGQALNTLSGGEAQRLKLALALTDAPPGGLVVLDEPTAGLHAEDVKPLLKAIDRLVDRGDTVIVVEHDMRVAAHADWVIDIGPGAGDLGGELVVQGRPEDVAKHSRSCTAPYLSRALGVTSDASSKGRPKAKARTPGRAVIRVEGAREHNLKDLTVEVPREKLVVVSGPSGSGKSTLAFDVIFAEGQRRFLETLSPYARQYLPQLPRADVDRVTGVPPTVALEQRITRGGANSTVATVTEVAHYLRLLWAKAGQLHCPDCSTHAAPVAISARAPAQLADDVIEKHGARAEVAVLAPVIRGKKGHYREQLEGFRKKGFAEARIDGVMTPLASGMSLSRFVEHDIELLCARVKNDRAKLEQEIRRAAQLADGSVVIFVDGTASLYSTIRACPSCGRGFPELDPRFFSFNTAQGRCDGCEGKGFELHVVGKGKTLREEILACTECDGTRLSPLARWVTVDGHPISDVLDRSVEAARRELSTFALSGREADIGKVPLAECERRLAFLEEVGLGYLGLGRAADTLSGGETQRVRLAAQLGAGLTGLLYVLDEPTIGLHSRDTDRLIRALIQLRDRGNTILVVEHDADVIRAADHVIDVGPEGGKRGGRILASGSPSVLSEGTESITGRAITRPAVVCESVVPANAPRLMLRGASGHNLDQADIDIPLGKLVAVTGVSGSGKSTLVRRVLLPAVRAKLGLVNDQAPMAFRQLKGAEALERAVMVDQSPIGRTPRSIPATYVGIWDELRKLFAQTPEARARGWGPSRFSFNVAHAGRCPTCDGNGALTVEMAFLPDVYIPCETCKGMRFTRETLVPKLHGCSVGELLRMEIGQAAKALAAIPKVARPLDLLVDLGLGYLELGQPSHTLSGGEAQRIKLVSELGTTAAGKTLYVLDEPTTGLHRDDVTRLIRTLRKLVDRGDTVVVVEHQLDVILGADWVIDLGPEGGEHGGHVVVEGAPRVIAAHPTSHTGAALRDELKRSGTPTKKATKAKSRSAELS